MEFKIDDLAGLLEGELLRTLVDGSILMRIGGNEHNVKILRSGTSEFEFILDNIFHYVKVLGTSSAEARLIVDGQHMNIRKHSKLTEVLEKSSTLIGTAGRDRNLISQIPGRVVSLPAKAGSEVKKGDIMIIIESMKMQVAVKAHKDGNIKEIRVKQGMSVARNDVLAIIE